MAITQTPVAIVNDTGLGGAQTNVQTTHLSNGGFVVAWTTNLGGQLDVMFQRYDAAGNQVGNATVANSTAAGDQTLTDIVANGNGTFTLAWASGNTVTTRSFNGSSGAASSAEINSVVTGAAATSAQIVATSASQ